MEAQFADSVRVHLEREAIAGRIALRLIDDFVFEEQLIALY